LPEVSDNCGILSLVNDYNGLPDATDDYPSGTTTFMWTATDLSGNTTTCVMTVTVNDTELPAITCPDDVVQPADPGSCQATVTIPVPAVSDNCGVREVVNDFNHSGDASGVYPVGLTTVVWTVTDIHGLTTTCTMTVTVNDEVLPLIICPEDITVNAGADECDAYVTVPVPETSDNCGVLSVVNDFNGTPDASGAYPPGTTTVFWTVTDVSGNTTICTMHVIVNDDMAPVILCPDDITFTTANGVCHADLTVGLPAVSDNCGIEGVVNSFNGTPDASGTYATGTTVVTWTVTDVSGNTTTCSMTVTVLSPPLANDDYVTVQQNFAKDIDILANDVDCLGSLDPTTVHIISPPSNGTAGWNATQERMTYTPRTDYQGQDAVQYTVFNTNGQCDTAWVYINIPFFNRPPVASNIYDTTLVNVLLSIDLTGHCFDPDSDPLTITLCSSPANGSIEWESDHSVYYLPNPDFAGKDSICYSVCDNGDPALCDTAMIYILVWPSLLRDFVVFNTITPNGDGFNDYLYIQGIEHFPDNELVIFNQWGDEITTLTNYNNSVVKWAGTNKNGNLLPSGTYYYILKLNQFNRVYNGWIYVHY
jgi:gliding motility-associated-like protein